MATRPDDEDDETLELTEADELKPGPDDEQDEGEDEGDDPDGEDGEEGEGAATVTFGDEDPDSDDPADNSTIRRMRQELRETKRKLAEAEKAKTPPVEIGEKPTLESCGYDADAFEKDLDEWKERKAAADRQQQSQAEENRRINEAWQADLSAFEQKKGRLEFEDRDEAIDSAVGSFDQVQQAVIVKAAADPALFLYALSKSEAKRDELAKIHDPIKMAAAVARMEGAVKVTKGRKAPDPDRPARGSAAMPGGADKQLEKLEKEANAPGGDRTKLIAYKKKLKEREKDRK